MAALLAGNPPTGAAASDDAPVFLFLLAFITVIMLGQPTTFRRIYSRILQLVQWNKEIMLAACATDEAGEACAQGIGVFAFACGA